MNLMQSFLVLFLDQNRPPLPKSLEKHAIELGDRAYVVGAGSLVSTEELGKEFKLSKDLTGVVVRMDAFYGYSDSSTAEKLDALSKR